MVAYRLSGDDSRYAAPARSGERACRGELVDVEPGNGEVAGDPVPAGAITSIGQSDFTSLSADPTQS
jgi:hypothetical protein